MPHYEVYTDGCCMKNPGGRGGCAAIIVNKMSGRSTEIAQGFRSTTNNRMEIMAVLVGLEAIREQQACVAVYSDSRYVVDAISKGWAKRWKKNSWRRHTGEPALNADLWERILQMTARYGVTAKWIRGHDGHRQNERCDYLAGRAAVNGSAVDHGYENANRQAAQGTASQAGAAAAQAVP